MTKYISEPERKTEVVLEADAVVGSEPSPDINLMTFSMSQRIS